jgi:hypothetical protein
MRSIPKDSVSISRLAAGLAPTGISKAGLVAAAKILGLHIAGDLLHLPREAESDFFKKAELADRMLRAQQERRREAQS